MKIPQFPQDFYLGKKSYKIDDKTIQKWIKECISSLEKEKDSPYTYIKSGDTRVTVFRMNSHEDGADYEVIVSKNEHHYINFDEE